MEYLSGKELLELITDREEKCLSMRETVYIMKSICSAVQYLHERGIAVSLLRTSTNEF